MLQLLQENAEARSELGVVIKRIRANSTNQKTHIVSFSGGIGSFITAKMVVDRYGADNTILLFADTKMEDEDLYRFNNDCVSLLGCQLVTVADGRNVWEVFRDIKYIGNTRIDPCSRILKRELLDKWITKRFSPDECEIHVGIDFSENHRLPPIVERKKPWTYRALMVEEQIMLSPEQKKEWCERTGVKAPRLYNLGFPHNNCGGFCVKAGLGQFKLLYENLPDRYIAHEQYMESLMANNKKLKPFLRRRIGGVTRYMTMKEYREEFLETGNAECDAFDVGGCGCALE